MDNELLKYFDIEEFNRICDNYGELDIVLYLRDNIIDRIDTRILKDNDRRHYLIALFSSLSWLQECLFYVESYPIKNNFEFDLYWEIKAKFLEEIGIEYNGTEYILKGE